MRSCALAALFVLSLSVSSAATISGTVRDPSGNPIPNARIDHIGIWTLVARPEVDDQDGLRTGPQGQFRAVTQATVFVIRKPGYMSQRIQVAGDADLQVTLSPIQSQNRCRLSTPPKFKTKSANDVDYTANWYWIKTQAGRAGIIAGSGGAYSFGAPSKQHIHNSTEYSEFMLPNGVIDAAGRDPNGTYWRSRTIFGKAAHYSSQTRDTADRLDCIMDRLLLGGK